PQPGQFVLPPPAGPRRSRHSPQRQHVMLPPRGRKIKAERDLTLDPHRVNRLGEQSRHLRLWFTPLRFRGRDVYIGTISRDIGVYFTTRAWSLTTHAIDAPDDADGRRLQWSVEPGMEPDLSR